MTGKLIVIEGSDASGKATQAKLLVERFEKEGQKA
ncbi:MAG: thymidylate kinase, partial [archaeon]|nr:thymidylate kinase [archaeon]